MQPVGASGVCEWSTDSLWHVVRGTLLVVAEGLAVLAEEIGVLLLVFVSGDGSESGLQQTNAIVVAIVVAVVPLRSHAKYAGQIVGLEVVCEAAECDSLVGVAEYHVEHQSHDREHGVSEGVELVLLGGVA